MIKTFCLLLTVMMLCFTNICTATNWTWINSELNEVCNEYIDLNSIEPKIYAGEPTQVSAWVKIEENSKAFKKMTMKLTFDYKNRLIYITEGRIDNLKTGAVEKFNFETRGYPVTLRDLNINSDFYWYVKDKFTGRNDFTRSVELGRARLIFISKEKIDNVDFYEFIDTMSIQENDNLLQFDTISIPKGVENLGFVGVLQYTRDGKHCRYKKIWRSIPGHGALVEIPNSAGLSKFETVFPDSKTESEYELVMKYCKEHPEEIGKNVLE